MCIRDRWEIVGIDIAEIVEHGLAMCVHPLTVVVQFPADTGKIEFQHQIGAVSYTHLDVYKRQVHHSFVGNVLRS